MPSAPVVLVAHGSRDPRAAATTRAFARAVAAVRPGLDVRVAFLEQCGPSPAQVLSTLQVAPVVVPLLLTRAYHGSVDLPGQVSGYDCVLTEPLGAAPAAKEPVLAALTRRLHAATTRYDGVVLAAAGTRVVAARESVAEVAAALGARLGVPCEVGYAATGRSGGEAVAEVKRRLGGCGRIAVASYFLAPGRLYDAVAASALAAGAAEVAQPLGASWDLARLAVALIREMPRAAMLGALT